ncbi:hypothetical protein TCAL_02306 [Tigriopus californicus]|uniref:uracil phosphoribosyltransferase n=1 Tax=Tigriopus californicus TaxID=6832 RepID=A0A553NQ59_TIGCA|nr:uncharacterized protein LOC131879842 [Tigriopus californicus]TRY67566.1 hypothetical protein TCAL_02306 [Tigriopus californicus]|eukprot:TCALIF_02306-PA protein Name:"Similar to FUR1 Uracil phosphoribosyltransferase (Saccharomyces cerevisiae (strain ATCC 204508 / S288c))" AED:0.12 eAED:0.12 QI:119/1/0.75/1/1/1/4/0/222
METNGHSFKNVTVIQSRSVQYLLMKVRNKNTKGRDYVIYADRLMRILAEEAICRLPHVLDAEIETPCGTVTGPIDVEKDKLCVVSIVRSGDILQEAVRQLEPGVAIGKILIQRDEKHKDKIPILYYKKLPKNISECTVMLVDPMLATAGSATMAIRVLVENGVEPKNIMFLNLICAPEGLNTLNEHFPEIKIITGAIDTKLDQNCFIVPGLGDYGDRYYQTE